MLGTLRRSAGHLQALDRIRSWTRARYGLPGEAVVMVSEIVCAQPGCPPLETVVLFWTPDQTRHRLKIFKPAEAVIEEDLPPGWLRRALIAPSGFDDDCC
ncbi:MAG TPA: hypothetical protein VKP60_09980 [Magnetospirillaceae bacterium]|nr:hypothetical protein [Magnetospirillaceae bacterium]